MRGAYTGAWGGAVGPRRQGWLAWLLAAGAAELWAVVQLVLASTRDERDRLLLGSAFGAALLLLVAMATCRAALAELARAARPRPAPPADEALRHELLNRLSLAVGYCALVAEDPRLPADLRELLLAAQGGAEEAADGVRALPRRRPVRLAELVGRVLPRHSPDRWG